MSVWWRKQSRGGRRAGGGGRSRWNMAGALSLPMLAPRLAFYPAHILWEWVPHDHIKQRLFVVNKAGAASLRVLDLSLCIALSLSLSVSLYLSLFHVCSVDPGPGHLIAQDRQTDEHGRTATLSVSPPAFVRRRELRFNWDYPWTEIKLGLSMNWD